MKSQKTSLTLGLTILITVCTLAISCSPSSGSHEDSASEGIKDAHDTENNLNKSNPDDVNFNLFEVSGNKQSSKDFSPAPDKVNTSYGILEFEGGAFPTESSATNIFDQLDLQRATQAYIDFMPALSLYGIVKSQVRDFDLRSCSDIGIEADFMQPSENYLTGNNITVYAFATLDLGIDGPTVVEIPPGMYGNANDAAFKYLTDFGTTGPDKGNGGKYLFVAADYQGDLPDDGYYVIRSHGYRIWAMMRGFDVGHGDDAVNWFSERLKVYPLKTGPRQGKYINVSGMGANTLVPEDGSAFQMLDEIIQYEPSALFDQALLGKLASIGIVKGKAFDPDNRMKRIFDQAAKEAVAMSRAILYRSRERDINYWNDRHWEKMFLHNTTFLEDGVPEIDAQTLWHYQAICVSPNLLSTTPGVGTAYLTASKDNNGEYLLGDKYYKLNVPTDPPVKRFWAVTAYDPLSRSLLDIDGPINVGSQSDPVINQDGSVDLYFGANPPDNPDLAKNWIKTDPSKGFFVVFRFYGPTEGYINKTWVLNDFERIDK